MSIIPRPYEVKLNSKRCLKTETVYKENPSLGAEEYILHTEDGRADIQYGSERARFYADKTLAQLMDEDGSVPDGYIHDKPRFAYRAFMIDSARHYQELDEIKKIIRAMAGLKMNVFHWHLSDDQGWRIESERHPELNAAAVREFSNFGKKRDDRPYGIYYTKEEIRDIVSYAAAHYIDVVPEVDIPGHTSAMLHAFPKASCRGEAVAVKTHQGIFEDVLCPAKDVAVALVKDVFDELCDLFPFDIYHIGGDEVKHEHWQACPDCQKKMQALGLTSYNDYENYFLGIISDFLAEKGKRCIVWNDAAKGKGLNKENMIVQYWLEKTPKDTVRYANDGGKVILSPFSYYYLDYDYDITSLRRVLSFVPALDGMTEQGRANVIGIEAPIWTEFVNNNERFEELLFPRIIGVACTAWQQQGYGYNQFLKEAAPTMERLQKAGYTFRARRHWGYTPAKTPAGWLRFVKTNYSAKYILGKE